MSARAMAAAFAALVTVPCALRTLAAQPVASARGTVRDATTGAPVAGAAVEGAARRVYSDTHGRFALAARVGDTLLVRRMGYRPARSVVASGDLDVSLAPAAVPLDGLRVEAHGAAPVARLAATEPAGSAREAGAVTAADLVARLPYVSARGARGATVVSLRGGRAEQTVVTLDGLPLNDPATGTADLGDLPLAAIGAATSLPGADAVRFGSGASGGVVALAGASEPVVALRAGSYGERLAEAAGTRSALGARLRGGLAWREARNDFPFRNRAAATGGDSVERRANNDERRAAAFGTATWPSVQLLVLASESERGMVGPMNVRAYDADRGRTRRLLARGGLQAGGWIGVVGARAFGQRYEDPRHPGNASHANVLALDAEISRALGGALIRAGAGGDRLRVAGAVPVPTRNRGRGFAAASREWARGAYRASAGLRADAYERSGARPSASLALERTGVIDGFVRVSQAFRAPTLNDVALGAPRRVAARDLDPERVALDAEGGMRARRGAALLEASVFHRVTHDAIVWFPGNFDWSPTNVGRERVLGAEGRAAFRTAHVETSAWAAWYRARLRAGGLVIPTPYVPEAAGGATATVRRGSLSASGELRAFARRPFASAPRSRATELPGAALLSGTITHRFALLGRTARLALGVDNAGDVAWESVERFPAPGRTWSLGLTFAP